MKKFVNIAIKTCLFFASIIFLGAYIIVYADAGRDYEIVETLTPEYKAAIIQELKDSLGCEPNEHQIADYVK